MSIYATFIYVDRSVSIRYIYTDRTVSKTEMMQLPLQLYDKEQILDSCLAVFARYGYEKTSTAMLAEAAGISRALIFHHFKSKKELYLSLLDRCFARGRIEMGFDNLLEYKDFFAAKKEFSIIKFNYYKKNPDLYNLCEKPFLQHRMN